MKQIAIIGQTASGKSNLALKMAPKLNANILSLDSLSIYKEIDIASAKPSKEQLLCVKHFGINEIYPDKEFSIFDFIKIYKNAYQKSLDDNKNLIIVGGSSFYLYSMIEGLSKRALVDDISLKKIEQLMQNREYAYEMLYELDSKYMEKIAPNDTYRVRKSLEIYISSNLTPTQYFAKNKKQPIININDIDIFEISTNKEELAEKISNRTSQMIKDGLIEEIKFLINRYKSTIKPIQAIGLKETLAYIVGDISSKNELQEQITINTKRLAKRQKTFNKSKFKSKTTLSCFEIEKILRSD
jgi:tRNA dimethylallyltransferase